MTPIKDGPSCPGCGLANYEGMCPHCLGDAEGYERELVPPFPSIHEQEDRLAEQRQSDLAEYEQGLEDAALSDHQGTGGANA